VRVPFKPAAAGLYIVGYQLTSSDGHPAKGEVRFTLTAGTAADPSASPSAAASASPTGSPSAVGVPPAGPASATPGSSTASTVPAASEQSDSGGRWWIWALGGLLLLAALGAGAVAGAFALPHLRRGDSADPVVSMAVLVFAGGTLALAWVRDFALLSAALVLAGAAWMGALSSLNVAIQTLLPSWVRARGLSVYMLVFFGGLTGGSALWGGLAERWGSSWALTASAAGIVLGLAATFRLRLPLGEGLNLAPSRQWPAPIVRSDLEPERGPVLVMVRFEIAPERAEEFRLVMAERRRIRLRDGALEWGLFADSATDGRYTEIFLVKSWLEHLRQHERLTESDFEIDRAAHAFHRGPEPPAVEHLIGERLSRPPAG
jgi:MFS family permease